MFNARNYRGHEMTVQPGYDHANGIGFLVAEVAGKIVGTVADFISQVKDLFFGFFEKRNK